jgi:hypothetical protein
VSCSLTVWAANCLLQSFAGIVLDSVCIGIFYARFSRANVRVWLVCCCLLR